jgi:hypothetical protein
LSDFIEFLRLMFRSLRLPNLSKFLTFKDLPEPFNHLAKPLVLVSVGLHAALLFAPIPSPPSITKPVEPKPKTVKITALPPPKSNSLTQPKRSSKTLGKPLASSTKNQLVIQNPKKTPNKIAQDPKTQQKNTPQPDSPPAGGPPSDPNNPFGDFPHYPTAGPGCLGLESCYQTPDSLDVVVQHFAKQLPLKYPDAKPANDSTHPHVFRFSKNGVTYFLSIVTENKATIYAIEVKPQTLDDIKQAIEIPSDFSSNILANLPDPTDALPENFESPLSFFTSLGGALPPGTKDEKGKEIGGMEVNAEQKSGLIMKLVPSQAPQQLFNSYFTPNLGQLGYQPAKPMASFGGGLVYELKKGTKSKPFYLNLVPKKGGKGTIVVVWPEQPS